MSSSLLFLSDVRMWWCVDAAEPPSVVDVSPSVVKAAVGRSVNLTCRALGAPTPLIVWSRGQASTWSAEHLNDTDTARLNDQFSVDEFGTLTIQVTTALVISFSHVTEQSWYAMASSGSSAELSLGVISTPCYMWISRTRVVAVCTFDSLMVPSNIKTFVRMFYFTRNHPLSSTCVQHAKMVCNNFAVVLQI